MQVHPAESAEQACKNKYSGKYYPHKQITSFWVRCIHTVCDYLKIIIY